MNTAAPTAADVAADPKRFVLWIPRDERLCELHDGDVAHTLPRADALELTRRLPWRERVDGGDLFYTCEGPQTVPCAMCSAPVRKADRWHVVNFQTDDMCCTVECADAYADQR